MIPARVVTRENQVAREEEPIDASVLSPFPTRQPAAVVEQQAEQDEAQKTAMTTTARHGSRMLRSSPSAASLVHSATASQQQHQQQPRPKRFNLRDSARDAIKAMREGAEAKQMVVAEALYGFYNTEISLHFLHALSAYFIRVAKYISLARRRQQPLSPETGTDEREEAGHVDEGRERATLLREVGRSYGRVILYCSNFEKTTADALFFESLLCLARMVVATAVAEPSLAPEIDREFDRILRGGVFHPSLRPAPRPPARPRNSSQRQALRETPHRIAALDRQSPPDRSATRHHGGDNDFDNAGDNNNGKSAFSGSTRGGRSKKMGGTGEPGGRTGSMAEPGSSNRQHGGRGGSTAYGRRNNGGDGEGSQESQGRHPLHSKTGRGAPVSCASRSSSHHALFPGRGGRKQRLQESTTGGARAMGGGAQDRGNSGGSVGRASSLLPVFDELSRWKVTRGSVSRMVRLAGEAQRMALSNLTLSEGCRRAVATKMMKKASTALSATTTTTTQRAVAATGVMENSAPTRSDSATRSVAAAAAAAAIAAAAAAADGDSAPGKKVPFWKRRGRVLTRGSGGTQRSHANDGRGDKEFFCAEALSVCIASVVDS
ncbi:unnamed protein product [Pylaiella littoralis]